MASELLKAALVREATRPQTERTDVLSDSRISVMTGVHRKDIKRLRSETTSVPPSRGIPVTTQVISAWLADPTLRGPDSRPLPLPRKKREKSEIDFDDLVGSISKDIRPRVVLDELLDRKVIQKSSDDMLELDPSCLLLGQDDVTLARFMGMNIHDHLSVAVSNYLREEPPKLERNFFYEGLSQDAVAKLAQSAERLAMQILLNLNEEARSLARDPRFHGDHRINFGVYLLTAESTQSSNKNDQ